MPTSPYKSLFYLISTFLLVSITTLLIILFAQGYRLELNRSQVPTITLTGLISATSQPKSALVYLNDLLVTATDDTLNLKPGKYVVKIIKDGYLPWTKTITVKPEIVVQTNASLFRLAPELKPITTNGASNPIASPDNTKIIFVIASASASADNGLYYLDLSSYPFSLNRNLPKLISRSTSAFDWAKAKFAFSPDSSQLIISLNNTHHLYYFDSNFRDPPTNLYSDITAKLPQIQKQWQQTQEQITKSRLDKLPTQLKSVVNTQEFSPLFSSDGSKVLYLASQSATLQNILSPPPPAQSTQTQNRQLITGSYYVYDLKDDTNFLLGPPANHANPVWLSQTNSLVFINNQKIYAIDYDSTNLHILFENQFNPQVAIPLPDSDRIITLLAPYPGATQNLYSITIR